MQEEVYRKLSILSLERLALFYDQALERKILNGTDSDPVSAILCDLILAYVNTLSDDRQREFFAEHDKILLRQFLGW